MLDRADTTTPAGLLESPTGPTQVLRLTELEELCHLSSEKLQRMASSLR